MKGKRSTIAQSFFTAVVLVLMLLSNGLTQDIGTIKAMEGIAEIQKSQQEEFQPANQGGRVGILDSLRTQTQSKVWISLDDNSHHSLGESSLILLNAFGQDNAATYLHTHIFEGAVRFIKELASTDPPSSYTITTPTAVISVEPVEQGSSPETTDFVVQILNPSQSVVTVIEGTVRVANISEEITTERVVHACHMVYIDRGKEPSTVIPVSSDTLRALIQVTTIPNTLSVDVPDCAAMMLAEPPQWGDQVAPFWGPGVPALRPDGFPWPIPIPGPGVPSPWPQGPPWPLPDPGEPRCPCPPEYSLDADGQCRPCHPDTQYDDSTCSCRCQCPEGTFFQPSSGTCVDECPAGVVQPDPDPNVIPNEGCPTCTECPCPPGQALDPDDNQCKPCAAGATYNPETCSCECCTGFRDPIMGTCVEECPAQMSVPRPGFDPPDPAVLPHEGCPHCDCCDDSQNCLAGPPNPQGDDCTERGCSRCSVGIWGHLADGPYPCTVCCECDNNPGGSEENPCGTNAAGFPNDNTPCQSDSDKCISRQECEENGGFFEQQSHAGGLSCWICLRDEPEGGIGGGPPDGCEECRRSVWKNGQKECVPEPDDKGCYKNHKCGKCKDGECVKLPPCPEGMIRNGACKCVKPEKPSEVLKPLKTECSTDAECRQKTAWKKPCCKKGVCVAKQKCPDGKLKCECEPERVTLPPPQECGRCEELFWGKCRPCAVRGKQCDETTGKCAKPRPIPIPVPTPIPKPGFMPTPKPKERACGRCEELFWGKCRPCSARGKLCDKKTGRCVKRTPVVTPKPTATPPTSPGLTPTPKPTEKVCKRCEERVWGKCRPCSARGKQCDNKTGRCIRPKVTPAPTTTPGITPRPKPTHKPTAKVCKRCQVRVRGVCRSCSALGKVCDSKTGRCVTKKQHRPTSGGKWRRPRPGRPQPTHTPKPTQTPKPSGQDFRMRRLQ